MTRLLPDPYAAAGQGIVGGIWVPPQGNAWLGGTAQENDEPGDPGEELAACGAAKIPPDAT